MDKLGDVNNYHDLGGLQNLRAQAKADPEDKEALKKAAQHFESIFIGMMLKSMREANAVFEEGNPMHSNTTKFFRDMYDSQLATDMATNGSMGLADVIVQQLSNDNPNYTPASMMRNDSDLTRRQFGNATVNAVIPNDKINPVQSNEPLEQKASSNIVSGFNQLVDNSFSQAGLLKGAAITPAINETARSNNSKAPLPNFDSPDDFISSIWQYAKKAASKIGVNPAVMVAQSALETGWGKHIIKDKNGGSSFNLFNVKAHRDWSGEKAAQSTLEFEQGVAVRKVEPFRVYNNFTEAFDDFVNFLKSNPRYEDALKQTSDSEQFLQNLQKAGYATDPNYSDKIIGILKSDKFNSVIGKIEQQVNSNIGA